MGGLNTSSSRESVAFSSFDSSNQDVSSVTKQQTTHVGDSCAWYADQLCMVPRSCFHCLNVLVVGDECAIDSEGACVSLSTSTVMRGSSSATTSYSAANYSYCSSDDESCSTCEQTWINEYTNYGEIQSPMICTGTDGCICLATCVYPDRDDYIVKSMCSVIQLNLNSSDMARAMAIAIAMSLGFILLLLGIWKYASRNHPSQEIQPRRRSLRGPQLTLTGWTSMREKLVETEHVRLGQINGQTAVLELDSDAANDMVCHSVPLAPHSSGQA